MTEKREGFKRVTVCYKQPNLLFEEWLTDLYNNSAGKQCSRQNSYGKALKSLKKYPLPLKTGKECMILDHFGIELCKYLDYKLKKQKELLQNGATSSDGNGLRTKPVEVQSSQQNSKKGSPSKQSPRKKKENEGLKTKRRSGEAYVPELRSGPYALLVTLLSHEGLPNFPGHLTKVDLLREAQPLCDASLTKPVPGSRYSAWSSMSTLVRRGLVSRTGCPARFSLTSEGREIAVKIVHAQSSNQPSSSSQVHDDALELSQPCTSKSITPRNGHDVIASQASQASQSPQRKKPYSEPVKRAAQSKKSPKKATLSSQPSGETDLQNHTTVSMQPGTFDIILLVDTSETTGNSNRTKSALTDKAVSFEVRRLKVGDFTWIARDRTSKTELLLPYIVERKRMDDLGGSIKDGRFHEQKFRLKQSGIANLIYLVESHGNNEHLGLPLASVQQAAVNTRVVDGFQVKYTNDHAHSMLYLAAFSQTLKTLYKDKTLISCRKDNLGTDLGPRADVAFLITYDEFNKTSNKIRNFTVREMFIRQLLQLHGLSVEKAVAIAGVYDTPRALMTSFRDAGEELLSNIPFGTNNRKLGPTISNALHRFYTSVSLS